MWGGGGPYQTWVDFLRRWRAQEPADPATLPPIEASDLTQDALLRLSEQLSVAIDARLQAWARLLSRTLSEAPDAFRAAQALVDGRAAVQAIRELAAHPGLPAGITSVLAATVDTQIRNAQDELERAVDQMRRDGVDRAFVEDRLRVIRDNSLTAAIAAPGAGARQPGAWPSGPSDGRRRVIVDSPARGIQ